MWSHDFLFILCLLAVRESERDAAYGGGNFNTRAADDSYR